MTVKTVVDLFTRALSRPAVGPEHVWQARHAADALATLLRRVFVFGFRVP